MSWMELHSPVADFLRSDLFFLRLHPPSEQLGHSSFPTVVAAVIIIIIITAVLDELLETERNRCDLVLCRLSSN